MVIGYHIIIGAYGFWLPNDPRGSWSSEVWAKHLRQFGRATKVDTRHSLAHREHDHTKRLKAKQRLKYPPVRFTGVQARAVGRGFAKSIAELSLNVYACVIMPDHVHLATGRYQSKAEYIAGYLKRAGTQRLSIERLHPMEKYQRPDGRVPTPWAKSGWFVYLNTPNEMRNCIRYVEENPIKEGLPRQRWSFVEPYEP